MIYIRKSVIFKVLKTSAKAKISVWNKKTRRFKNSSKDKFMKWRDTVTRYYYLYEEKEVINLFKAAGFKIIEKEKDNNIIFVVEKP